MKIRGGRDSHEGRGYSILVGSGGQLAPLQIPSLKRTPSEEARVDIPLTIVYKYVHPFVILAVLDHWSTTPSEVRKLSILCCLGHGSSAETLHMSLAGTYRPHNSPTGSAAGPIRLSERANTLDRDTLRLRSPSGAPRSECRTFEPVVRDSRRILSENVRSKTHHNELGYPHWLPRGE